MLSQSMTNLHEPNSMFNDMQFMHVRPDALLVKCSECVFVVNLERRQTSLVALVLC